MPADRPPALAPARLTRRGRLLVTPGASSPVHRRSVSLSLRPSPSAGNDGRRSPSASPCGRARRCGPSPAASLPTPIRGRPSRELESMNHLTSSTVPAGSVLLVPRRAERPDRSVAAVVAATQVEPSAMSVSADQCRAAVTGPRPDSTNVTPSTAAAVTMVTVPSEAVSFACTDASPIRGSVPAWAGGQAAFEGMHGGARPRRRRGACYGLHEPAAGRRARAGELRRPSRPPPSGGRGARVRGCCAGRPAAAGHRGHGFGVEQARWRHRGLGAFWSEPRPRCRGRRWGRRCPARPGRGRPAAGRTRRRGVPARVARRRCRVRRSAPAVGAVVSVRGSPLGVARRRDAQPARPRQGRRRQRRPACVGRGWLSRRQPTGTTVTDRVPALSPNESVGDTEGQRAGRRGV